MMADDANVTASKLPRGSTHQSPRRCLASSLPWGAPLCTPAGVPTSGAAFWGLAGGRRGLAALEAGLCGQAQETGCSGGGEGRGRGRAPPGRGAGVTGPRLRESPLRCWGLQEPCCVPAPALRLGDRPATRPAFRETAAVEQTCFQDDDTGATRAGSQASHSGHI